MMAVRTEHEKMMLEVMEFTSAVVSITQLRDCDVYSKANAILLIEQMFHKMIMDKIVEKCEKTSTPCLN